MSGHHYMSMTVYFLFPLFFLFIAGCSTNVIAPVSTPGDKTRAKEVTVKKTTKEHREKPAETGKNRDVYIVKKGDTLYSIAWNYGFDYRELAQWNNIKSPYVIYPEQKISLVPVTETGKSGSSGKKPEKTEIGSTAARPTVADRYKQEKIVPGENLSGLVEWTWPTRGKLIKYNTPIAKKGINIAGNIGQVINAAAGGHVVYSGSGLLGYGKLIIIKHSETYLSAYAHNNKILVREGEKIASGQKIAEMGVAGNGQAMLHFEIRKNGQPDDPLRYLPKI